MGLTIAVMWRPLLVETSNRQQPGNKRKNPQQKVLKERNVFFVSALACYPPFHLVMFTVGKLTSRRFLSEPNRKPTQVAPKNRRSSRRTTNSNLTGTILTTKKKGTRKGKTFFQLITAGTFWNLCQPSAHFFFSDFSLLSPKKL